MAWNEPGGNKQDDNAWQNGNNKQDGPPDLDDIVRKFRNSLGGLFGKKRSGNNSGSSHSNGGAASANGGSGVWIFVVAAAVIIWALSGIYIVDPAERAVILHFGKYSKTVLPGPHWLPRFIDSKTVLNVSKVSNYKYSDLMLTKDENIVSVSIAVQYKIGNAENYLFNVSQPVESLQQATASALRQVIGSTTLDNVLTVGREQVRQEVSEQITEILDAYKAGVMVTDVAMQPAQAPEEVKAAFDDAIKAQEDEQRFINQAQAYAMGVVPKAQGQAKRILQEAQAYQQQVVLKSQGDVARFLALLPEYKKQPEVTRERLYLDAVQSVLTNTSKVFVDTSSSNNLLYLPMDQLIQQAAATKLSSQGGGKGDHSQILPDNRGMLNSVDALSSRQGYGSSQQGAQ